MPLKEIATLVMLLVLRVINMQFSALNAVMVELKIVMEVAAYPAQEQSTLFIRMALYVCPAIRIVTVAQDIHKTVLFVA